ncbi:hypothetical protein GW17_00022467 [Ensete ventricosum]|nr:hypothetical protein GW17_00022467 [Ensete ventricosum]
MVDIESLTNILYYDAFQKLGLSNGDLVPMTSTLTGFTGDSISPLGITTLPITLRAVVSMYHRTIKFPTSAGVDEVRSDPRESRQCYLIATTLPKKIRPEAPVADPREPSKLAPCPEPIE